MLREPLFENVANKSSWMDGGFSGIHEASVGIGATLAPGNGRLTTGQSR